MSLNLETVGQLIQDGDKLRKAGVGCQIVFKGEEPILLTDLISPVQAREITEKLEPEAVQTSISNPKYCSGHGSDATTALISSADIENKFGYVPKKGTSDWFLKTQQLLAQDRPAHQ